MKLKKLNNIKYRAQYAYRKRNKKKYDAYQKEYQKSYQKAHAADIPLRFNRLRRRTRELGTKTNLTLEEYEALIYSGCYYCGADLFESKGISLDRTDNDNYNYTKDNVVPCCVDCNNLKNYQLTKDETVHIVKSLKRFRKKHGKKSMRTQNEIRKDVNRKDK